MKKLTLNLQNLISDDSGQDLIEYALVASLIGLVAVAALTTLGAKIATVLGAVNTALTA